jgi:hypothetical protein
MCASVPAHALLSRPLLFHRDQPHIMALSCCTHTHILSWALQISLVLVDEVHLLSEAGRGSSLEAGCVCRIKALAALPEMAQVQTHICCFQVSVRLRLGFNQRQQCKAALFTSNSSMHAVANGCQLCHSPDHSHTYHVSALSLCQQLSPTWPTWLHGCMCRPSVCGSMARSCGPAR